jgi:hypothetical protein
VSGRCQRFRYAVRMVSSSSARAAWAAAGRAIGIDLSRTILRCGVDGGRDRESPCGASSVWAKLAVKGISMPHPATRLEDLYRNLSPEPLMTPEEIRDFYSGKVNEARGEDKVVRLQLELDRAFGGNYYKTFLMGHPGVGKSTELTRLVQRIGGKYRTIRFSATMALDPSTFKPFDVLLLMMALVTEQIAQPIIEGGAGEKVADELLKDIWEWFATETNTTTAATTFGAEIAAGAGVDAGSMWAKVLGLFIHLKGEVKYASDRETKTVEYRLSRLSTLVDLTNRLLDECTVLLRKSTGREWLFIGEDFDKPGIVVKLVEDLFITYGNVFKSLRTHLIFTIPVALGHSHQGVRLPCPSLSIPDTPVYEADHSPCTTGREALQSVLEARVDPALFDEGQVTRLIIASGGNLRDLFSLVREAGDRAIVGSSPAGTIRAADVNGAIDLLRTQYSQRLGTGPYDAESVPYEEKAKKLIAIYVQDPNASIPDSVLYSLLRSKTVQEFNGRGRYGVPPLVVDILKSQGRIDGSSPGGTT